MCGDTQILDNQDQVFIYTYIDCKKYLFILLYFIKKGITGDNYDGDAPP